MAIHKTQSVNRGRGIFSKIRRTLSWIWWRICFPISYLRARALHVLTVWWPRLDVKRAQRELGEIQRLVRICVSGAMKTQYLSICLSVRNVFTVKIKSEEKNTFMTCCTKCSVIWNVENTFWMVVRSKIVNLCGLEGSNMVFDHKLLKYGSHIFVSSELIIHFSTIFPIKNVLHYLHSKVIKRKLRVSLFRITIFCRFGGITAKLLTVRRRKMR